MTAYTLLKYLVLPHLPASILIQAAAGGVGIYLVQLAKLLGIKTVIGLVGSDEKAVFVSELGADFEYTLDQYREAFADLQNRKTIGKVFFSL